MHILKSYITFIHFVMYMKIEIQSFHVKNILYLHFIYIVLLQCEP